MTKWKTEWGSNHPLYQRLSSETKDFLKGNGEDILCWLWDSNRLIEQFKSSDDYYDYSFLIAPAYKGLEKWLLVIAPFLGVPQNKITKAEQTGRLGLFLNDESLDEFFDNVLGRLKKTEEKRKELRVFIQSLNSTLKVFRHNPAHCGNIIDHPLKAESDFFTMLNIIDSITKVLIEEGIISQSKDFVSSGY